MSDFHHPDENGGRVKTADELADNSRSHSDYDDYDDHSEGSDDSTLVHTRLFDIIEEGMPRLNENRQLTAGEANQRKDLVEQTWDRIRKWLWNHQDAKKRADAVTTRGNNDATPLHNVCKLPKPPTDIVQAFLEASSEPVTWADSHGWLPLHHACANGASGEVLQILSDAYPKGKTKQDSHRRTPLHFYLTQRTDNSNAMAANMQFLSNTGAPELADIGGMLPMHYACAYGVNPSVLAVLREAYPESLIARENKGRTPMHLAMVNAHRDASPGVIQFLLENAGSELVNVRDHEGYLPLHLLALGLKGFKADDHEQRSNVSECLRVYLVAEPKPTADFLTALQDLPDWLQDVAVVTTHVRKILNEKIVQRFPTFMLFLDLFIYLCLVVVFSLTSTAEIKARYTSSDEDGDKYEFPEILTKLIVVLYLGATYFLIRELFQIVSLWSLGSISSWFYDPYNWLDVLVIVVIYYFSILMTIGLSRENSHDFAIPDDSFRSFAASTHFILWLAVISFLRTTLVDFATFVGGIVYVIKRLGAFSISLLILLMMFAQIFYFLYYETEKCKKLINEKEQLDDDYAHCTFNRSMIKVITMMMGEIGSDNRYADSRYAQIVYLLYCVLIVILLSNVLIAIVTESYEVIQNDRAASVFWGNRLSYVAEMDAISYGVQKRLKIFGGHRNGGVIGAPTQVQEGPYSVTENFPDDSRKADDPSKRYFKNGWKNIVQLFDQNIYDDIALSPRSIEFWCYFLFQVAAVLVIIPLWLLAGLMTFGFLWPPQIREYIFVQKETTVSRANLEKEKLEQLKEIQTSLKCLKVDIKKEMASDREDMIRMKHEVESTQNDVMSDLQQVRELMTTLLEMGRRE